MLTPTAGTLLPAAPPVLAQSVHVVAQLGVNRVQLALNVNLGGGLLHGGHLMGVVRRGAVQVHQETALLLLDEDDPEEIKN